MNLFRRFAVVLHRGLLELLLLVAVIALVGQLSWPAASSWWRRPTPGRVGVSRFDSDGSLAGEYLLYLPGHGDGPWPLIVFLHGSGQRGADPNVLRKTGPLAFIQQSPLPAIVAAPQCLPDREWEPESVRRFVEHVTSRYHVDAQRIYLVGYSMGGFGVWQTATAYPKRFAGIVPISGGGNVEDAKAISQLPTWAFHGKEDEMVPVTESERMVDAIRAAGGSPKLTIIHQAGHGICQEVCGRSELWQWLLLQRLPRGER